MTETLRTRFGYRRRWFLRYVRLSCVRLAIWVRLVRGPSSLPERPHRSRSIPRPCPLVSDYKPQLQPLLVTGTGRSGSTWLMRLLLQDDRVVVYSKYPHEMLAARHWMRLLQTYFDGGLWLGQHPLMEGMPPAIRHFVAESFPREMASFCQRSIDQFYLTLAKTQGQTEPLFFGEKGSPSDEPALIREVYPNSKEIFLVRDFRDTFCSIRAFNMKRLTRDFGWGTEMSDEDYLARLGAGVTSLLKSWRSRRSTSLLLRYEDLVGDPVASLTRVFEYANLPVEAAQVAAMVGQAATSDVARHRTTQDGAESIERWRRDLSPDLQALALTVFGEALEEFGYARA